MHHSCKTINLTLFVEVPDNFDVSPSTAMHEPSYEEEELDAAIARVIAEEGYRLTHSEPYEEVLEE